MDSPELDRLRERAYGPKADIHLDPAALERLRVLEQGHPPTRTYDDGQMDEVSDPSEQAEKGPPNIDETRGAARSPLRRRWLVGVVALAVTVAAAITITSLAHSTPYPGASLVATLRSNPAVPMPRAVASHFDSSVGVYYGSFEGLAVVVERHMGATGGDCLVIVMGAMEEGSSPFGSVATISGCGSTAFPAQIVMAVTTDGPSGLSTAYPGATAALFVQNGEAVDIYIERSEPAAAGT